MKQRKFVVILAVVLIAVLCVGCLAACNEDPEEPTPSAAKPWEDGKTYSYRMGPSDLPTSWNYHTYQSDSSTYILDYASDGFYTFDYNDDRTGYKIVPSMATDFPTDVTADYVGQYGIVAGDENKAYSIPLKTNLKFDNGDPITAQTFVDSMKLLLDPRALNFRADNMWTSGELKLYGAEGYFKNNRYTYDEFVSSAMGDDEYIPTSEFTTTADGYLQYQGKDIVVNIKNGMNWGDTLENNKSELATGYVMHEGTDRAKVFDKAGNCILTRTVEKEKIEGQDDDYRFYDLDGNLLPPRYVNDEGTAWVYLDKNGVIVPEWAGCAVKTVSTCYDPLAEAADKDGYVKLTPALLRNLQDCIARLHGFADAEAYAAPQGDYDVLLIAYYGMLYDGNADALKEKFAKLTPEEVAELAEEEYKEWVVDVADDPATEDVNEEEGHWADHVGVENADQYAIYMVYVNAVGYAEADSQPNDYAWVEFEEMAQFGYVHPPMEYDGNVGLFAKDDQHLIVVLQNAMEDNFYLRYELSGSFFLVHPGKYQECISYNQDVYSNDYGTAVNKFIGYGPYKLTSYVADNQIVLERNMNWHGYSEGEYVDGTYQTDRVVYTKVTENATRLEMFLKGQLDSYGLQEEDMDRFSTSEYVYYNDSESTWYLAMNPQFANLQAKQAIASPQIAGNKVIKTVLSIQEFRQALSYSLDRAAFNATLSPTSGVAKALLSSMIIADPDSGLAYRETVQAKDAILSFWGLSDAWGEGKEYATREEAIASITGYDPAGAKTLFTAAYDKAVADGMISAADIESGKWEVQIIIGKPAEANFYTRGIEYLSTNWTNAVVGTPFEGHLTFVASQVLGSTTFGNYLRDGSVDILFGVGYGGSMFNPYSMMDCFTGGRLQYDTFTNMSAESLDVTIDLGDGEKTYRASLKAWVSDCLQGKDVILRVVGADGNVTEETKKFSAGSSADPEIRITILAKAEEKILTLSNIFPMQTDATASLRCMRITYATENYILGVGRGGLQYYTYAMDDTTFEDYARGQEGGVLKY